MGVKGFHRHSYNTVVLFCTLDALWWVCILLTWSDLCILTFYHSYYSPDCDQETRSSWSKPSGTWRFYGLLLFKGWCLLFFFKMCSSFTRIQLADPLKDSNSGNRARRVFRTEGVDDLAEGGENMEKLSERVSREADSFLRKVFFSYFLTFLATKELSSPANTLWRYIFR